MRLNLWNVPVALVIGIIAIWAVLRAINQYTAVTESIIQVDVEYVPNSFIWLDPLFDQGQAQIDIINRAERSVTVDYLELHLYFDDEFAGAWYETWEPVTVPAGEKRTVTATFTVTSNSIQQQGGQATLSLRGYDILDFDEFEEQFTIQLYEPVGNVSEIDT